MARCSWCKQDMMDPNTITCTWNNEIEFPDGSVMASIPYNPDYGDEDHRCHDCNVKKGQHHHPGCDMERCPKCEGQLIGCGCLDDDEPDEEEFIAELQEENRKLKAKLRAHEENEGLECPLCAMEKERDEWKKKWEDLESHRRSCCVAMEEALQHLVQQIELGEYVEEQGHNLKMNVMYLAARAVLEKH